MIITNDPFPGYLVEGKNSLEESFADTKDDLTSSKTTGTTNRERSYATTAGGMSVKIEGIPSSRKHKTTNSKGKKMVPKIAP